MFLNLNQLEKKAMAKAIRLIITCDNNVAIEEKQYYLNGVLPQIGMSNSEFEEAKNFDTELMRAILKKLTKSNRVELIKMMLKMMLADGTVNNEEMKMFNSLCLICELDVDIRISDIGDNNLATWFQTSLFTR